MSEATVEGPAQPWGRGDFHGTEFLRAWYRRVAPMSDCESREQAALIDFALAARQGLGCALVQLRHDDSEGARIAEKYITEAIALYAKIAPTEGGSDE